MLEGDDIDQLTRGFKNDTEFIKSIIDLQKINKKQEIFDLTQKYSNLLIQNISALQEWSKSQIETKQQVSKKDQQMQQIKLSNYDVKKIHETDQENIKMTASISNNLKYIIASVRNFLHIWDYKSFTLIKKIDFDCRIDYCKFSDDSQIIYVAVGSNLFQLQERQQFKFNKQDYLTLERDLSYMIITNNHILAAHQYGYLCQYDIQFKKTNFEIKAHEIKIKGLDYDKILKIIATGSYDNSIIIKVLKFLRKKTLIEEKQARSLASCDKKGQLLIWKIITDKEQLSQLKQIKNSSGVYNFSLVLKEEYILLVCKELVKIYSIDGELIKEFNHHLKSPKQFTTVQVETLEAIVLIGQQQIRICKQNG
ncbi:hypothetical protein pb186bvf_020437 [Paramecium bursaria]